MMAWVGEDEKRETPQPSLLEAVRAMGPITTNTWRD